MAIPWSRTYVCGFFFKYYTFFCAAASSRFVIGICIKGVTKCHDSVDFINSRAIT